MDLYTMLLKKDVRKMELRVRCRIRRVTYSLRLVTKLSNWYSKLRTWAIKVDITLIAESPTRRYPHIIWVIIISNKNYSRYWLQRRPNYQEERSKANPVEDGRTRFNLNFSTTSIAISEIPFITFSLQLIPLLKAHTVLLRLQSRLSSNVKQSAVLVGITTNDSYVVRFALYVERIEW